MTRSGRTLIDVPEVIEAADEVDRKLPHPPPSANNWGTVSDRLDEAMKTRLLEIARAVL